MKTNAEKTYSCTADQDDTLTVEFDLRQRVAFQVNPEARLGVVRLCNEDIADLARRLAEHVGLTIEPEPFKRDAKFEDIRKGDLVRASWHSRGFFETKEGVVSRIADIDDMKKAFVTDDQGYESYLCGLHVCGATDGRTITILSRPEPEPEPEPLPTTPGAVIKIFLREEWTRVNLGADGYWRGRWADGDDMEVTGNELSRSRGIDWDRFEVVA